MTNIIDLAERRQLREIVRRVEAIEAGNRELRLQLTPGLRSRVALARVCEFQTRFAGLLKHLRAPLQEAMAWAIADQLERGEPLDYRVAMALVCGFGVEEFQGDRAGACRERIGAEYARLSSVYGDF